MNVYSYIKAQNYQGFDVDIVRKILIQLMQALMFLHHVESEICRERSFTVTLSLKMLCLKSWGNRGLNLLILDQHVSRIKNNLLTFKADTTDPHKLSSWNLMTTKSMSGVLVALSSKFIQEPRFFLQELNRNRCKCCSQLLEHLLTISCPNVTEPRNSIFQHGRTNHLNYRWNNV